MTNIIYLICGVPGSGKTWVCERLIGKFTYVPHDDHLKDFVGAVSRAAFASDLPILSECPFGERLLKEKLESEGFYVVPLFVVEQPSVIEQRYTARERKPFPKAHATRAMSIKERAIEWGAVHGSSDEILAYLKAI